LRSFANCLSSVTLPVCIKGSFGNRLARLGAFGFAQPLPVFSLGGAD
jgi:hypothetical protein